jgi:hypothetical protein
MKSAIALFLIAAAIAQAQSIILLDEVIDRSVDPFKATKNSIAMSRASISVEDAYIIAEKEADLPSPPELFSIIEAQSNQIKPAKIEISMRSHGVGSIDHKKPILILSWYIVKLGLNNEEWVYFAVLEDRTIIWGKKHEIRTNQ